MPILFAITGSALGSFAEGAILAASVYLVSRGVRNPLKNQGSRVDGRPAPSGAAARGSCILWVYC